MSGLVGLAAIVSCLACGDSAPGPVEACENWLLASCTRYAECLHQDQAWIDQCVQDNHAEDGTCEERVAADECLATNADAIQGCADSVAGAACDDICSPVSGGTWCWEPCVYYCSR